MSSKNKRKVTLEGRIKLPLSLALVAYSIVVSDWTGTPVVMAMLMSFCGDIYMMKYGNCFYNKGDNDLNAGMFAFMMSHILYANLMNTSVSKVIILTMVVVATVYAIAIAFGLKNQIALTAFYVVVLILSVINTYFFNTIAFAGGMLFLVSDFAIGIFDIIKKKNLLRHVIVWGTYVPAQILLLTSFIN